MITKKELELFELLGEEVDKELSEGCYIQMNKKRIVKYIRKAIPTEFIYNFECLAETWWKYFGHFNDEKKILWHYPSFSTVLRFINENCKILNIRIFEYIGFDFKDKNWQLQPYRLIFKEPKDYTEEELDWLLYFLKQISC